MRTRAGDPFAGLVDMNLTRRVVEAEETTGRDGDGVLLIVDVGEG